MVHNYSSQFMKPFSKSTLMNYATYIILRDKHIGHSGMAKGMRIYFDVLVLSIGV